MVVVVVFNVLSESVVMKSTMLSSSANSWV